MKIIAAFILTGLVISHASAQVEHEWCATLKVLDELGMPISGANAGIGYYTNSVGASVDGLTDTNGVFRTSHVSYGGDLGFVVEKAGYYTSRISYKVPFNYDAARWNPTQTIILKRIIKPIPMYAKWVNTHVPNLDKPVGYDFEIGDWVGPYGKGVNADIFFTGHFDKHNDNESDFRLTVNFPKTGDGIQEFNVPQYFLHSKGSVLLSAQEAPTNGYQPEWIQTDNRKPGKPVETNRDLNRNYYFRVRTKVDDRGNIVSALYGKIYGDFMQFAYYLNPTPNDRSVEFDPKQNLMKNLKFNEGVGEP